MTKQNYLYARASSVSNVGADIGDSARHKRNQWRSLAQAEEDGTAEGMVTAKELLKNEPHKLLETITIDDYVEHYTAYLILLALPNEPWRAKNYADYQKREDALSAATLRQHYYTAYMDLKALVEEQALLLNDSDEFCRIAYKWSSIRINSLRKDNYWNPVANTLVYFQRKLKSYGSSKSLVRIKLKEFYREVGKKGSSPEEILEIVKALIKGKTLKAVLEIPTISKPKGFTDEDDYGLPVERIGGRKFGNIDANMMIDTFGLRGLQFGNSLPDKERLENIRCSWESFYDLSDIIGWEGSQMGIGNLGLAFGARGHGRALAHYEPIQHVINLTRMSGAGSLAHEWFHGLDFKLQKTLKFNREELFSSRFLSQFSGNLFSETRNFPEHFADEQSAEVYLAMREIFRLMVQSGFSQRLRDNLKEMVRTKQIEYKKVSYYESNHEKAARCFEMYVQRKLESKGCKNTYLSGAKGSDVRPNPEETAIIEPGYDALFKACKSLVII